MGLSELQNTLMKLIRENGSIDKVTEFIYKIKNELGSLDYIHQEGETPLTLASWTGNTLMVKELTKPFVCTKLKSIKDVLTRSGAYVNFRNAKEETPLMKAAIGGHIEIVKILIRLGADVNCISSDNATALRLALNAIPITNTDYKNINRQLEIAILLIEEGAEVAVCDMYTLCELSKKSSKYLYIFPKTFNKLDKLGDRKSLESILAASICFQAKNGDDTIVNELIGVIHPPFGNSALKEAIDLGLIDTAYSLMKNGIIPSVDNILKIDKSEKARGRSLKYVFPRLSEVLTDDGIYYDHNDYPLLSELIKAIEFGNFTETSKYAKAAMELINFCGVPRITFLHDHGREQHTPLTLAAQFGSITLVSKILQHGVRFDTQGLNNLALPRAITGGNNPQIVTILLRNGIDVTTIRINEGNRKFQSFVTGLSIFGLDIEILRQNIVQNIFRLFFDESTISDNIGKVFKRLVYTICKSVGMGTNIEIIMVAYQMLYQEKGRIVLNMLNRCFYKAKEDFAIDVMQHYLDYSASDLMRPGSFLSSYYDSNLLNRAMQIVIPILAIPKTPHDIMKVISTTTGEYFSLSCSWKIAVGDIARILRTEEYEIEYARVVAYQCKISLYLAHNLVRNLISKLSDKDNELVNRVRLIFFAKQIFLIYHEFKNDPRAVELVARKNIDLMKLAIEKVCKLYGQKNCSFNFLKSACNKLIWPIVDDSIRNGMYIEHVLNKCLSNVLENTIHDRKLFDSILRDQISRIQLNSDLAIRIIKVCHIYRGRPLMILLTKISDTFANRIMDREDNFKERLIVYINRYFSSGLITKVKRSVLGNSEFQQPGKNLLGVLSEIFIDTCLYVIPVKDMISIPNLVGTSTTLLPKPDSCVSNQSLSTKKAKSNITKYPENLGGMLGI